MPHFDDDLLLLPVMRFFDEHSIVGFPLFPTILIASQPPPPSSEQDIIRDRLYQIDPGLEMCKACIRRSWLESPYANHIRITWDGRRARQRLEQAAIEAGGRESAEAENTESVDSTAMLTRPSSPTAAFCLLPASKVRWMGEPRRLPPQLWKLFRFLLSQEIYPVGQDVIEEAVWDKNKPPTGKRFASALSALNTALLEITFPWTWHIRHGEITREDEITRD